MTVTDGGMVITPGDIDKKSEGKKRASLVSPVFNIEKASCIRIKVTSKQDARLQVSIFSSLDVFDTKSAEYFEIVVAGMKDQKFNIPVTNNAQRVMFSFEPMENDHLHLQSVALLSDYQACSSEFYHFLITLFF